MIRPLSLAQHTLYADLLDQGSDDLFDPDRPENGSILVRGNRAGAAAEHAYYQGYRYAAVTVGQGQRFARYLGRVDDPDVAAQIARFQRVKAARTERITTVRALIGAGMPHPNRTTGRVIEALARAELFTDHAVLIGEAAFQTYDGVLGVRLAKPGKGAWGDQSTLDIVARDRTKVADILDVVHTVDPSFAGALDVNRTRRSPHRLKVAVTSLDQSDAATAARLGFLIADPVQAIVLHGPGIPVAVPALERFAVHALIEAGRRPERALSGAIIPDHDRIANLIDALLFADRAHALADAFVSGGSVYPEWQRSLRAGIADLPEDTRSNLSATIRM